MTASGSEKRAKKVEQVRAMFEKARSTDHPEEAEAFEAKALQIMAQWEIDERELADAGSTDFEKFPIDLQQWGSAWDGICRLWAAVGEMNGGFFLMYQTPPRGLLDPVYTVGEMTATGSQWERIRLTAEHMLDQFRVAVAVDRPLDRRSYALAWVEMVTARLLSAQAKAYEQVGTALVPTTAAAEAAAAEDGEWETSLAPSPSNADPESIRKAVLSALDADLGVRRLEQ